TVAVTEVPQEQTSSFGILQTDAQGRVTGFQEKPKQASSRLASMGVYLFDRASLIRWLVEDAELETSSHDFGKDLLPRLVARGAVVRDSIVMHDATLGRDAVVDRAIVDKEVRIGAGAMLGHGQSTTPNRACPEHLSSGLTVVGKGTVLPAGITIGRNARIGAFVPESAFAGDVPAGGVLDGPESTH